MPRAVQNDHLMPHASLINLLQSCLGPVWVLRWRLVTWYQAEATRLVPGLPTTYQPVPAHDTGEQWGSRPRRSAQIRGSTVGRMGEPRGPALFESEA